MLLTHRPLYADPGDAAFACLLEDRCGELLAHYAGMGITGACLRCLMSHARITCVVTQTDP